MIELTVEGIPQPVRVDPSFRDLSPDRQAAAVEDIKRAWDAQQRSQAPAAPDTSFAGALRHGASQTADAMGTTARVLGNRFDNETARNIGTALDGAITPDPNYQPATPEFIEGIRNLDSRAVTQFPRAVVEALPGIAGTVAAGAAGSALGGPVGGLLAAGTMGASQTFGQVAEERARRNGTAQPTDADLLAAGGTALVSGALDAVGARGAGAAVRGLATGPRGVAERVAQAGRTMGREGVTESAQDVVEQVGGTAGTTPGLEIDPARAVGAGALGAGARGVTAIPGSAARGAIEDVARRGAEASMGDMPPAQAESVVRLNAMLEDRYRQVVELTGRQPAMEDVLNGARQELDYQIEALIRQAGERGWISHDERSELNGIFSNARRHNQELVDGVPTDDQPMAQGLARLDSFENTPPVFTQNIRALLTDLNTLAHASRRKNTTGPFESLGRLVGGGAGIAAGAAAGGPFGALAAGLGALGGNPLGARVGGSIGRAADRLAGTRMPALVLARQKAERILKQAGGLDPGNTWGLAAELDRVLTDERLAARAALGLPTDADTMAELAAKQARRRLERDAEDSARNAQDDEWRFAGDAQKREAALQRAKEAAWEAAKGASATPEDIQKILDAERRAEALRKAGDVKRSAKDAPQEPDDTKAVAALTAAEVRGWEASLAAIRRAQAAAQTRTTQDAKAAEQGAATDADALARAGETDAQRRAREIEAAYKQRDAQSTQADKVQTALDAAQVAEAARKEADLNRAPPGENPEPNLDAVTKDQVAEWERLLAERAKANQAKATAKAAEPKPQEAPPPEAPVEPAQAPEAPPATTPAAPPPEAVQTPAEAPREVVADRATDRRGGPLFGWRRYVQVSINGKGHRVTTGEMDAAVRKLGEDGDLLPDEVEAILRQDTDRLPPRVLSTVIGEVAKSQGWVFEDTDDVEKMAQAAMASGRPGPGYYAGVERPASWQGVADAKQEHARFYREQAVQAGDFGLAEVLASLTTRGDSSMPPETRKKIAQAAVRASPEGAAGLRRAALAPWLDPDAEIAPPPAAPTPAPTAPVAKAKARKAAAPKPVADPEDDEPAPPSSGDGTVAVGDAGRREDATDALLRRAEATFAKVAPGLRVRLMDRDDVVSAQAEASLQKLERQIREIRAANVVWRARVSKLQNN